MVLVDTSVWVEHLRRGQGAAALVGLLQSSAVLCHRLVIGELACGRLSPRDEILRLLRALPRASELDHDDVMEFVEAHRLMAAGIGFTDAHLLAAAVLERLPLWTLDKKLRRAAEKLGREYAG